MESKIVSVVTTINSPSASMQALINFAESSNGKVIVVGDAKTPKHWIDSNSVTFLSLEKQLEVFGDFAKNLPVNHYSRKNLGYLLAKQDNFSWMYETDDDNFPTSNPFLPRYSQFQVERFSAKSGWVNVYNILENSKLPNIKIWPRGFALHAIGDKPNLVDKVFVDSPLQQGLANGDPDVDAIFRLTVGGDFSFKVDSSIGLYPGNICPTNSQTTWWSHEILQLAYLPSTCTFRLTDILRGFIAWRLLDEFGKTISFHSPVVFQDRNEHNLYDDFAQEIGLYVNSHKAISQLLDLDISGLSLSNAMELSYQEFAKLSLITEHEFRLLELWSNYFK